jgi:hypothetical protein
MLDIPHKCNSHYEGTIAEVKTGFTIRTRMRKRPQLGAAAKSASGYLLTTQEPSSDCGHVSANSCILRPAMKRGVQVGELFTEFHSAEACSPKGERSADVLNSGETVYQSVPVLKRPTPSPTDGRTPSARLSFLQPKTGQGAGWNPAIEIEREALDTSSPGADCEAVALSDFEISQLLDFFRLLDRWDQEGPHATKTM